MASYTPGINLATTGMELGAPFFGPGRLFHDLGANNGDLIRSGNASVVRFGWLSVMDAPVASVSNAGWEFARGSFPLFFGFACSPLDVCTYAGVNNGDVYRNIQHSEISTTDNLIGRGLPAGTIAGTIGSGGTIMSSDCPTPVLVPFHLAWSSPSFSYNNSTNSFLISTRLTPYDPDPVTYATVFLMSLEATGPNTVKWSLQYGIQPESVAAKKSRLYSSVRSGSGMTDNIGASIVITTGSGVTAKQFIARFPYFLIQWPSASYSLNMVHAEAFVSE